MRSIISKLPFIAISVLSFTISIFADNCFILSHPTSDPAPSTFSYNGVEKVYFYCTQDMINKGNGDYPIDTIHCFSTTDMYHWKDEGVSLDEKSVSWAKPNVDKLWAPSVVFLKGLYRMTIPETSTDGKFYNFMATSKNPIGPFTAGPPLPGFTPNVIDPFIFIDSDSTVWMSFRHQDGKNLGFVQMNDSATKITGNINNCLVNVGTGAPSGYKEGSWMWKRGKYYFLVFAGVPGSGNEIIGYSTSQNRMGPWTYRGQIFSQNNSPSEFTIHSGACEFKGQTYIFWHNVTFGGSIFGSERCSAIEYLTYKNDSTINTAAISKTNRGVGVPSAYGDSIQVDRGDISGASCIARAYNSTSSEKTGWHIGTIKNNNSVVYDSVNFTAPADNKIGTVSARISSQSAGGSIEIHIDSAKGTLLGTIQVPNTTNLNTWVTTPLTTLTAIPPSGNHNIVLIFKCTTDNSFQVNWIQFGLVPSTSVKIGNAYINKSGFNVQRLSKNAFNVTSANAAQNIEIRMLNVNGREIAQAFKSKSISGNSVVVGLDAKNVSSGAYILSIKNNNRSYQVPFVY